MPTKRKKYTEAQKAQFAEKRQAKMEELEASLSAGLESIQNEVDWRKYLDFHSKFTKYSAKNTFLIWCQCPQATLVAGFSDWKKKHFRAVTKGEKGLYILAPCKVKRENKKTGDEEWFIRGFKPAAVFDISQTEPIEGKEDKALDIEALSDPTQISGHPGKLFNALKAFSESNGVPVKIQSFPGGYGCCRFLNGKPVEILVDPFIDDARKAAVLAHEITHSLLHGEKCYAGHGSVSEKEFEAESGAYVMAKYFGLEYNPNSSFAYIKSWIGTDAESKAQFMKSADSIMKAAKSVVSWIEETGLMQQPEAVEAPRELIAA